MNKVSCCSKVLWYNFGFESPLLSSADIGHKFHTQHPGYLPPSPVQDLKGSTWEKPPVLTWLWCKLKNPQDSKNLSAKETPLGRFNNKRRKINQDGGHLVQSVQFPVFPQFLMALSTQAAYPQTLTNLHTCEMAHLILTYSFLPPSFFLLIVCSQASSRIYSKIMEAFHFSQRYNEDNQMAFLPATDK